MSIVAGITNQDSSFFSIKSSNVSGDRAVLNEDIISFSYEEEIYKFGMGTLAVYDDEHYYSQVLRQGAILDISFGYASPDASVNAVLLASKNPNQLFGGQARTGVKAYIMNPSGKCGADGRKIYNCNFYTIEAGGKKQFRTHTGITKRTLVGNLFAEMGIFFTEIGFTRGNEILNRNTQIVQNCSNYRLLFRLAKEWRAIFRISTLPDGSLSGLFVSPKYIGTGNIGKLMSGAVAGDSIFLEYGEGVANVIEYSWKNHQGGSGAGDNVRLVMGADGTYTTQRYSAKTDSIVTYRFYPERVKRKIQGAYDQGKALDLMKKFLQVTDFNDLLRQGFFEPIVQPTAPQGLGYSLQAKMFGVPLMSAPLKVLFGGGFPVWFNPKSDKTHVVSFFARKVSHTIDNSGYKMDLDIVDAFTLTGGSLI